MDKYKKRIDFDFAYDCDDEKVIENLECYLEIDGDIFRYHVEYRATLNVGNEGELNSGTIETFRCYTNETGSNKIIGARKAYSPASEIWKFWVFLQYQEDFACYVKTEKEADKLFAFIKPFIQK